MRQTKPEEQKLATQDLEVNQEYSFCNLVPYWIEKI